MTHITKPMLKLVSWHLPGELEQRRIADFLDDRVARIDQIIYARQRQRVAVESLPWASFASELTHPATPRMPLRRAVASIADGPFGSAFSSDDYSEFGPAVIRLGNIGFADFRPGDMARVPIEIYDRFPNAHVRSGDLLVASLGDASNHAGRACVAPGDLGPTMVKGKCFVARANHGIASESFLATLLSSPVGAESLISQGSGATRNMLNFERLLATTLPIPGIARQSGLMQKFMQEKEETTGVAKSLAGLVDTMQEYKQSLITAAVTGEFDVTTASASLP